MKRRNFLKKAGWGLGAIGMSGLASFNQLAGAAENTKKPNVLFFLVDDMGWMDSEVYGSQYYKTPNLTRLAKKGILFTNAYAANPLCSPTRASIMTGKYPSRLRFTAAAGHLPPKRPDPPINPTAPPYHKMLTANSARYLEKKEYTLAEAFKDGGYETVFIGKWHLGAPGYWPKQNGFDINIAGGNYPGPPSYFSPYHIKTLEDGPEGEYLTDRLTQEALKYLNEAKEKPFFLCLWHYAVHSPFQAQDEMVETYRGKTDPRGKQNCEVMAAMIESMDKSLGQVMDTLEATGKSDNTIIVFMSDNGGNMYDTIHRFGKMVTPTNNAPLRNGKGNIHEGGVRTPCVFAWPGHIPVDTSSDAVISSIDFYPTLMELTQIQPSQEQLLDGVSLAPHLLKGQALQREAIFCHFPHYVVATSNLPSTSVRKGPWKLIRFYGEGPNRTNGYGLYNLDQDIGETNNLAEKMPEKVAELDRLIDQHLEETQAAVPRKNPNYDPSDVPLHKINPLGGWRFSNSTGELKDGALYFQSIGKDGNISCPEFYRAQSPLTVTIKMRSNASGKGKIHWGPIDLGYRAHRVVTFDVHHDNKMHTYRVEIPAGELVGSIRIHPCEGAGTVVFEHIDIHKPDGELVKEWTFEE